MARNDPQVNLRMPAELKRRLDVAAEESKRSLTAEIVARLEHSLDSSRAFEPNKDLSERLALADELMDLARGLMLQEVEYAKREKRYAGLEAAKRVSDEAKKRARRSDEPSE